MRDAGLFLIVFASITGSGQVARADLAPEDPYADVTPSAVMTSEALHAQALYLPSEQAHAFQPAPAPEVAIAPAPKPPVEKPVVVAPSIATTTGAEALDDEWYEQPEVQIGGGGGAGLVLLGLWLRGRRNRRRRELLARDRKTQFGMSAVDPTLAKFNVAAWEKGPAIMPIAIEPEMIGRSRAPSAPPVAIAAAPRPAPAPMPVCTPYRHYSAADLAAYRMGTNAAPPIAPAPAAPPAPVAPAMPRAVAKPVMMPHLMAPAPLPSLPASPAPRGSWHPTVLPWDAQAAANSASPPPSQHARAFAPVPAPPHHHARAFAPAPAPPQAPRPHLAAGTPPPPIANPQPFVGLPAAHRPLPGLPPHTPTAAPPQSFVLERSSTELPEAQATAHYPLTFPAFPEADGAAALAPIEPSGLNRWGANTDVDDFEVRFARGSQPAPQLDPLRATLAPSDADAETRIAPAPTKRTLEMHRSRR